MMLAQMLSSVLGGGDLRLVTYATGGASTIQVPSGSAANDLLVLMDRGLASTATIPGLVTPSGFTSINSVTGNTPGGLGCRANLSYALPGSNLSGSMLTGLNGDLLTSKILMVFRGRTPFATATPLGVNGQMLNGDPTAQTIAINWQDAPLIALAHSYSDNGILSMTGGSSIAGYYSSNAAKFRIYTEAPLADLTVDSGSASCATLQSCYIQLTY